MPARDNNTSLRPKKSYPRWSTHGQSRTKIYRIWTAMKGRCSLASDDAFAHYGGRGIKVCDRWASSFEHFLEDMGHPPTDKHSIDRIDNDGNYEPGNCRWATQAEQMRNTRRNRPIAFGGRTMLLCDWAKEIGTTPHNLIWRIKNWGVKRALTDHDSANRGKLITYNGESKNLTEWAKVIGIQRLTLWHRIKQWGIEKAFTEPPRTNQWDSPLLK